MSTGRILVVEDDPNDELLMRRTHQRSTELFFPMKLYDGSTTALTSNR